MAVQEGLFVRTLEEDGAAAGAGLREKDIITAVGDALVANDLDFELALFHMRTQPSVVLTVQRREAGTLTLELPLRKPEPPGKTGTPPGKRRNPLKKGRIESTGSPLLSAL
jgi:S1-C subfamily serine protease